MKTLCFKGYYTQRFARCREFMHRHVEEELDKRFSEFCNQMLQEEFSIQSGAAWYERSQERVDRRNGHYRRRLVTGRGVVELRVPRGEKKKYRYTLFKKNQRKTKKFDEIVVDALLKGHSSRKASKFFANMFGAGTISHQAAVNALKKFDIELAKWKKEKVENKPVVLVLDAVHLKGVIPQYKYAKPVLFAYAVYADGREEVLDFELVQGESTNAYYRFCLNMYDRGLKDVELVVHDDHASISEAVSLVWPKALDQQCVFHILQNLNRKLQGCEDKKKILRDASKLYEAKNESSFYRSVARFKRKWSWYQNHSAIKYFFKMMPKSVKYFELPEKYWKIAKTSNRLERLFEELKRRIRVFRRFPNPQSCKRWLYALLRELNRANLDYALFESQHNS